MRGKQWKNTGFTLIEVMIVVAIVAILAVIAYPSYQNHILKSQRADAHDALLRIQLEQERWRANNPAYTGDLNDLGQGGLADESADGHYDLAITASSGSAFTATATAKGQQANDTSCPTITLEVTGGSSNRTPADCW
ncbi:MAG: type IV pilin protein [Pseudomonadota bacterium]